MLDDWSNTHKLYEEHGDHGMAGPSYIPIPYLNTSSEDAPPFCMLMLTGDVDTASGTNIFSVKAKKPDSTSGVFAIDCGAGAKAASGTGPPAAGCYGQCYIPISHVTWVMFSGTAPINPWQSQVGPVANQWYANTTGSGFWFAGGYSMSSGLLLVNQLASGSTVLLGRATTAITPATNGLTGATLFQYKEWITLDGTTTPHTEQEATDPSVGVNRFTQLSAGVDSIVVIAKINGENQLIGIQEVCPT